VQHGLTELLLVVLRLLWLGRSPATPNRADVQAPPPHASPYAGTWD